MKRLILSKTLHLLVIPMVLVFSSTAYIIHAEPEESDIRVVELNVGQDYLFARAALASTMLEHERIIDSLVSTNLNSNAWMWIDANRIGAGTNTTSILIVPMLLSMTNMPQQLFLTLLDRAAENSDMYDRDADGAPNVYELNNDTNPYVSDYADAPKIIVPPNSNYAAFTNSLWQSTLIQSLKYQEKCTLTNQLTYQNGHCSLLVLRMLMPSFTVGLISECSWSTGARPIIHYNQKCLFNNG